jgi:membrane-associated protein
MDLINGLVDFILHIDTHLGQIIAQYGTLTYLILFAIIFCETGLVVFPFLPGDSLLFAAGAFAALGSLNYWLLLIILTLAATIGDAVNYWIGREIGPTAVRNPNSRVFRREYLDKTERFFEKHGGKAIILCRFVPIVRTFGPFMAGVGRMNYPRFQLFNIVGATLWVIPFVTAGYVFGNVPVVRHNFSLVVIAIVLLSLTPALYEWWHHRAAKRREAAAPVEVTALAAANPPASPEHAATE